VEKLWIARHSFGTSAARSRFGSVASIGDMIFERLPRRHTAILLVVAVVVLALVGRRLAAAGTARAPAAQAVSLRESASPGTGGAAPRLVVYVVGAVRHAGLVRLPEGARVADALERAGGPSRRADLTLVNLAAPVADGQQVVVPVRVPAGQAGAVGGAGTAPGVQARVSLASATLEQLDALPGIGPVTAQKILDWRQTHGPLRSVDDLDAVPGIGPARVEQLRDLVTP
jgi:competence protein ComEA